MGMTGVISGVGVEVTNVVLISPHLTDSWTRFSGFGLPMLASLAILGDFGDIDELYLDLDLDLESDRDMARDRDVDLLLELDFE